MYNKLFTKILDSSIWLEDHPTRIVWITLLAAMDQDGFAPFSTVQNLARRAGVTNEEAAQAVATLEGPDRWKQAENDVGNRIERVPGGYFVIKAAEYGAIVRREEMRASVRERVRRHREAKLGCNATVTLCNDIRRGSDVDQTYSEVDQTGSEREGPTPDPDPNVRRTRTTGAEAPEQVDVSGPGKPKKAPPNDVARFMDWWAWGYHTYRGSAYLFTRPKDQATIAALLKAYGLARLKQMAMFLWHDDKDEWIAKTDRGIGILRTKANTLADWIAQDERKTRRPCAEAPEPAPEVVRAAS